MIFILLVFFAAFALEGIGTLISILGLTQLLGFDWIIISLAVIFDISKLVSVSFLYKEWAIAPKLLRRYMTVASIVLVMITSGGAAGYLSSSFQKNLLPTKSIEVKVSALEGEKEKLELRKVQIDDQIAKLPDDAVKGRSKLISSFKSETEHLNKRLIEIDDELPKIKMEAIDKTAHSGPITYLAKALNISVEKASGFFILLIIFVFDPLAVALILAGNYLVEKKSEVTSIETLQTKIEEIQEEIKEIEDEIETKDLFEKIVESDQFPNDQTYETVPEVTFEEPLEEVIEQSKIEEPVHHSMLNDTKLNKSDVVTDQSDTSPIINFYNKM